ncbi:hypothetical protein QQS45_13160 [Alteriqipengyuania flavescens]|uniref:hypothetical protein n=1 Tax=Alteriqipengyuania flavescens TaxID=3053610 RepID=UPI0025B3E682|nr:hypothetical protein [Alteriqipengyuania flavescens]WJY18543.1 hypothetical protein QQW98_13155 [Alteriqipengyuania flavescens]WJY24483.1 hypothetical protein QQS45_13160 [Alteriqipengyuania flavescens]
MKSEEEFIPSGKSLALATLIAPAVAAILLALGQPLYSGLDYLERVWRTAIDFAAFAYVLTLTLGVPALLLLYRRVRFNAVNCALTGAAIAALPWIILSMFGPAADTARVGGRATVLNGVRTAYGHWLELQFIGIIAIVGGVAGFLFWGITIAIDRRTKA